jgi:hypothetical protein
MIVPRTGQEKGVLSPSRPGSSAGQDVTGPGRRGEGDAGIGKTALLAHLADVAREQGVAVVRGIPARSSAQGHLAH